MIKRLTYLCVLTSLIGANTVSLDFGVFQLSIFRGLIILITIFIILEMFIKNRAPLKLGRNNRYSFMFMAIWLLYAFFSLGWVKDYSSWLRSVYFIGLGFLCVIVFNKYLRNKTDILMVFKLIALMAVFHNLIGWYEISTGNYFFLSADRIFRYSRDSLPVSMFGNTNNLATFLLFSVFITYACAANTKNLILKLIYLATIISSIILLVMTKSRANILGLILASAVFVSLSVCNKRTRHTLLILLLGMFMIFLTYPEVLSNLFIMISRNLYFRFSDQTGSDVTRINLIKNGFLFLVKTFGFGIGAGNVEFWMASYGVYNTGQIVNMHNWWMEILTCYGIIIFIMYLLFYSKLFLSAYRKFKRSLDKMDTSISLGIMCCMAGYTLGSVSSSSNISSEWLWVFWAIAIAYQGMNINYQPNQLDM